MKEDNVNAEYWKRMMIIEDFNIDIFCARISFEAHASRIGPVSSL